VNADLGVTVASSSSLRIKRRFSDLRRWRTILERIFRPICVVSYYLVIPYTRAPIYRRPGHDYSRRVPPFFHYRCRRIFLSAPTLRSALKTFKAPPTWHVLSVLKIILDGDALVQPRPLSRDIDPPPKTGSGPLDWTDWARPPRNTAHNVPSEKDGSLRKIQLSPLYPSPL